MPNSIRVKRRTGSVGAPSVLPMGELAANIRNGVAALFAGGPDNLPRAIGQGGLIGFRVFNTPGQQTYTPTKGTRRILVYVTGAGGAGRGQEVVSSANIAAAGGGGGAGGTACRLITTVPPSAIITIGEGGVGWFGGAGEGSAASLNADGEDSSYVDSLFTLIGHGGKGAPQAYPGAANSYNVMPGGQGGGAVGGQLAFGGGHGGAGFAHSAAQYPNSACFGGEGGRSLWGGGKRSIIRRNTAGVTTVPAAGQKGCGGNGASVITTTASAQSVVGTDGGAGVAVIYEFA